MKSSYKVEWVSFAILISLAIGSMFWYSLKTAPIQHYPHIEQATV